MTLQTDPTTMASAAASGASTPAGGRAPLIEARGIAKAYGAVVALDGVDLDLYPGEVLALIGDNGAGKSTFIKCLTGAVIPDTGTIKVDGQEVRIRRPQDARDAGIETVYQQLSLSPALDIATNLFLGREIRRPGFRGSVLRMLDVPAMRREAREKVQDLGITTLQDITQAVETLSGGQRQAVAVARAVAFGSKAVILDEPTAALGVRESRHVMDMVTQLRARGLGVILISHDMQNVFEHADRIQIMRLGRRAGVVSPRTHTMQQTIAVMTGAATLDADGRVVPSDEAPSEVAS